jgi:pectate lyase
VNNYFKPGPATPAGPLRYRICKLEARSPRDRYPGAGQWHVAGNYVAGHPKATADNWDGGVQQEGAVNIPEARAREPFPAPPVTLHTAEEAFELVLAHAGATLPKRDPVDARIIESVRSGKPMFQAGIINDPADVGGWPEYRSLPPPKDTDHDGMPDAWEKQHGLDPDDAADGAWDKDKDGYTNLEEHLNGTKPTEYVDYTEAENNQNVFHKATRSREPK